MFFYAEGEREGEKSRESWYREGERNLESKLV